MGQMASRLGALMRDPVTPTSVIGGAASPAAAGGVSADHTPSVDEDEGARRAETAQVNVGDTGRTHGQPGVLVGDHLRETIEQVLDSRDAGLPDFLRRHSGHRTDGLEIGRADARPGDHHLRDRWGGFGLIFCCRCSLCLREGGMRHEARERAATQERGAHCACEDTVVFNIHIRLTPLECDYECECECEIRQFCNLRRSLTNPRLR